MDYPELTPVEREQIATILSRRANEIAGYKQEHSCEKYPPAEPKMQLPASAEYGLEIEIKRLRRLAGRINPPKPELDDDFLERMKA